MTKIIDYDYLPILRLRLLKMIMYSSIATTKILKRIGRTIFLLIRITISNKMFTTFINISFEIVYLSGSQPGPPEISSGQRE